MSENLTKHPHGGGEYEHEDLNTRSVFWFLLGMAIICIVMYCLLQGIFALLNRYDRAHQAPQHPLTVAETNPSVRRYTPRSQTQEVIEKTFPEPRLEEDERSEIKDFRLKEEEKLHSYGWVDQPAGVAHIPIERAMELVAERGLPVHGQNSGAVELKDTGTKTSVKK